MKIENLNYIVIESTSYCNARCPHCPRFTDDGFVNPEMPLAHLSLDSFVNKFNPATLPNLNVVSFEGDRGDPVMNPELSDMVKFFNFVKTVNITTNGSIQNETWWAELAKIPNLQVIFSIDGLADTNHIYRVGLDFDKIIANARAFINAGGKAAWKCLVFKHNEHQLNEIAQLSKDLGFVEIWFRSPIINRFKNINPWPVKIKGEHSHNLYQPTKPIYENRKHKHVAFFNRDIPTFTSNQNLCPWLKQNRLYINYLGHVIPCCMTHAETLETSIPSAGVEKFKTLVNGSFDNISLYHHTIDEILATPFYTENLENSLKSADTMHPVCARACGSSIQKALTPKHN